MGIANSGLLFEYSTKKYIQNETSTKKGLTHNQIYKMEVPLLTAYAGRDL